jgi:hypothetical protein
MTCPYIQPIHGHYLRPGQFPGVASFTPANTSLAFSDFIFAHIKDIVSGIKFNNV